MDRHFSQKRSKFNLSFDFFAKLTWLRSRNDSYSQFPRCRQGTPGTMTCLLCLNTTNTSRKIGWACAARFLKPLPYFRPDEKLIPYLRPEALEPGAWPERVTSCNGTYAVVGVNIKREMFLSPNDEEVANYSKKNLIQDYSAKTIPYFRPKWSKLIPYFRPKRLKNHTLWRRTYLYRLHKGLAQGKKRVADYESRCWRKRD